MGLEDSHRSKKDGYVYFGSENDDDYVGIDLI
jgi:hypothetical protein